MKKMLPLMKSASVCTGPVVTATTAVVATATSKAKPAD